VQKPFYITSAKWNKEQDHVRGRMRISGGSQTEVLNYLYDCLNIIDTKVSSLLTFNSILLAVASFAGRPVVAQLPRARVLLLFVAGVAWLASTILCLAISFLKWEHLDIQAGDFDDYRDKIIIVTTRRTHTYNIAVGLILISIFSALAFLLL
jgi:hypothetical protein